MSFSLPTEGDEHRQMASKSCRKVELFSRKWEITFSPLAAETKFFILRHVFIGFSYFSHQINIIHKLGAIYGDEKVKIMMSSHLPRNIFSVHPLGLYLVFGAEHISLFLVSCQYFRHILTDFKMWTLALDLTLPFTEISIYLHSFPGVACVQKVIRPSKFYTKNQNFLISFILWFWATF